MDFSTGPAMPGAEVIDDSTTYHALNPNGLTAQQIAAEYAAWSEDDDERDVQVRLFTESGAGQGETVAINAPPPPPLENLSWNQGGWPSWNGIDYVVVTDDGTSYNALNPEGWTLARAVQDYYVGYACENKDPHEVSIKTYDSTGAGTPQTFTIPVEEE